MLRCFDALRKFHRTFCTVLTDLLSIRECRKKGRRPLIQLVHVPETRMSFMIRKTLALLCIAYREFWMAIRSESDPVKGLNRPPKADDLSYRP